MLFLYLRFCTHTDLYVLLLQKHTKKYNFIHYLCMSTILRDLFFAKHRECIQIYFHIFQFIKGKIFTSYEARERVVASSWETSIKKFAWYSYHKRYSCIHGSWIWGSVCCLALVTNNVCFPLEESQKFARVCVSLTVHTSPRKNSKESSLLSFSCHLPSSFFHQIHAESERKKQEMRERERASTLHI